VAPAPEPPPRPAPPPQYHLALVKRSVADLEAALSRVAPSRDLTDRIAALEQSFPTAPISRKPSHPLDEDPDRSPAPPRRATAIEAYAEGLRMELRARATGAAAKARAAMERGDRAAALAADAGILGAPQEGIAQELRDAAAHAAARQSGLTRLAEEIEFYAGSDLSMASQLLTKLEETIAADPAPALEAVAQAVAGAANALAAAALASEPPPPALPVEPVASALPVGTASATPLALLPAANGSALPLLDLSGETEIRPEEAAAAAAAAARATKVVTDGA